MLAALLLLSASGCKTDYKPQPLPDRPMDADAGAAGSGAAFPITGINSGKLTITGVEPGTGPFSGGTTAVLRGSGFDDNVVVHVGGIAVQPGEIKRDGKNRLTIVVPAGMVGPADITITQGDTTVTLRDGFLYNALAVKPNSGAAAGGSLVELTVSGATLEDGTVVEFDGLPCTELHIQSPQSATCKTPPHDPGVVDVIARLPAPATPLIAKQSYEFAETFDATTNGLSGGPIDGTINVTVVADAAVSNVVPGALVMLGNDPKTAQIGTTDKRGAITFSGPDLHGPVTIHATAHCFQKASIVAFDARDVTVLLAPSLDPTCQADGELGPATKQLAATVSGELIFPGHDEFDVNTWEIIPKPKDREIRVAYVFTTAASLDVRRIPPDGSGSELARLVEGSAIQGKHGFLYRITARPGGLAVYALVGLERLDTRAFTPYMMAIAHNVVTSPGEETKNVDMTVNITLDRELDVSLHDYPAAMADGPSEFRVRAYADLGGEGLIAREVNNVALDLITRHTGSELFRFMGQPAFVNGLSDASYYVMAGYYSTDPDATTYTRLKQTGVRQSSQPLSLGPFIGIPSVVAPALGSRIPDDRTLRFSLDGAPADMILVEIYGGDDNLAWTELLPGDAREVPVPDFSLIPGQADLASGFIRWVVTAVKIDDFRYNEFDYTYLATRFWTHDAANAFYARR